MIGFEATEIINEIPENVFAFVEDTDLAPLWLIKVIKTENLTGGPVRAGTRFRETCIIGNRERTGIINIIRHDGPPILTQPPYFHSGVSSALGVQATYHYTFEATGDDQTRISIRCELEPRSFLGRLTCRMIAINMKREDSDQLTFLKKAIEDDVATDGDST